MRNQLIYDLPMRLFHWLFAGLFTLAFLIANIVDDVRNTTEKTARVQSMSIYAKAGISGRSELSAFFLEDLLVPGSTSFEIFVDT
jgi:hypothetical protein